MIEACVIAWILLGAIGGALVHYDLRKVFENNREYSEVAKLVSAFVVQAVVTPFGPIGLAFAIHCLMQRPPEPAP